MPYVICITLLLRLQPFPKVYSNESVTELLPLLPFIPFLPDNGRVPRVIIVPQHSRDCYTHGLYGNNCGKESYTAWMGSFLSRRYALDKYLLEGLLLCRFA